MTTTTKKLCIALCAFVAVLAGVGATGCDPTVMAGYYYPEYESGYFKYAVKTEKDGTEKAYLIGLTESGMEQTELIYPEEIDGIAVYGIGYSIPRVPGYEHVGDFSSEKLEKFYFPNFPKENLHWCADTGINNKFIICWDSNDLNTGIPYIKSAIFSYDFLKKGGVYNQHINAYVANVSYLYNYENSPNFNYYWVDSYDESVITFIPPEPQREGYKFDGWYKEAECINEWDFEKDKTGKEIIIKYDYEETNISIDTYSGLNLYAKWLKV